VAAFEAVQGGGLLLEMEHRLERADLLHQAVDQLLAGAARHRRDVVDRLLRVELGALAADLVEIVDQMAPHPEETGLEHGEQAARARADDDHVGPDDVLRHRASGLLHPLSGRLLGRTPPQPLRRQRRGAAPRTTSCPA
jgi:hypothetical protein